MLPFRADSKTRRLSSASGQGLVELLISMTVLSVAVGALISVLVAGAFALQRSDQKGTALALADTQLEVYRAFSYANIRLASPLPGSGNYVTAHTTDATIPAAIPCTGVDTPPGCIVVDNTAGQTACVSGVVECKATQTVTGPDHRTYEVDTYIQFYNPNLGVLNGAKQVLVVVRDPTRAGAPILARDSSVFQPLTVATS